MKFRILLASAAALGVAACGGGDQGSDAINGSSHTESDAVVTNNMADPGNMAAPGEGTATNGQQYATMAAASDMYEIESSRLALEKAQSQDIKAFAQMLIADHQKSTNDLKSAATQAEPAISLAPALDGEQQANVQALQAASGAAFDRLYAQQQVQAHQKALSLVQDYA